MGMGKYISQRIVFPIKFREIKHSMNNLFIHFSIAKKQNYTKAIEKEEMK